MGQVKKYSVAVVAILILLIILYIFETYISFIPGIYIGGIELVCESYVVAYLARWLFQKKSLAAVSHILWGCLFFIFLFIADASYIYFYYIKQVVVQTPTIVIATKFCYALAFLSGFISLVLLPNKPFLFWTKPIVFMPILFTIPVVVRFILIPLIGSYDTNPLLISTIGDISTVLATVLLINAAIAVFLSSRDLTWSFWACGIIVLVLGDWAMRVDTFFNAIPEFGFYEFLWGLGVLLTGLPFILRGELQNRTEAFGKNSIICHYKLLSFGLVSLIGASAIIFGKTYLIEIVKIVSLSSCLGFVLACLVCYYLASQVAKFSKDIGLVLIDADVNRLEAIHVASLPEELISIYQASLVQRIRNKAESDRQDKEIEFMGRTINLTAQVAHDIRSPLAALKVMGEFLQEVPEEKRLLIRSAVQRIEDIANDLAGKKQQENTAQTGAEKTSVYLLSSIIDTLVSEKRLQFRSRINVNIRAELDQQSYGLFTRLPLYQFKRVLSNLINNAVEAFEDCGDIVVAVQNAGDNIVITVTDNGKGIPADILPRLMQRGATFGKTHGKGLGLNHARETIENLGGKLVIESIVGQGTKVLISLPRHEAPKWFVAELKIPDAVIILDDDSSIHQIWENRLVDAGFNKAQIFHFTTTAAITAWCSQNKRDGCLFLMDYEILGENKTGLDMIDALKISNQAVMVTSRYEEENVLLRCEALRVKLLPKNLAGFVPIVIQSKTESSAPVEYVLIDDQEMNHSTWQTIGRIRKKSVATFFNPEAFFSAAPKLDRQVKIYVDSDLGNGIKGESVSKQIADLGFSEIFICTGYRSSDFEPMPWVKGVVGKKPPFV